MNESLEIRQHGLIRVVFQVRFSDLNGSRRKIPIVRHARRVMVCRKRFIIREGRIERELTLIEGYERWREREGARSVRKYGTR